MKTLMATDGSREATTALVTASRLLHRADNDVDVLCVTPEFGAAGDKKLEGGGGERAREEYRLRLAGESEAILERARQTLLSEGVEARKISEEGSPAGVIVRLAGNYDMTVVGATSEFDRWRPGIGPVASRVVEHAPGTVLVAREYEGGDGPCVLLCVDGSEASWDALDALADYFRLAGAEVTLIHVLESPWVRLGLDADWPDQPQGFSDVPDAAHQLKQEMKHEAAVVLDEARRRLEGIGVATQSEVAEGNPATVILGAAEEGGCDLIVLGATGASDVKHQMLGSVSARVAGQAPCSVAVVKNYG